MTAGPLFVLTWPLFSGGLDARLWASAVPMINGLRLLAIGTGLLKDDGAGEPRLRSPGGRNSPDWGQMCLPVGQLPFCKLKPIGVFLLANTSSESASLCNTLLSRAQ